MPLGDVVKWLGIMGLVVYATIAASSSWFGFFQCQSFRGFLAAAKLSTEVSSSPSQTDYSIRTGKNTE